MANKYLLTYLQASSSEWALNFDFGVSKMFVSILNHKNFYSALERWLSAGKKLGGKTIDHCF